MIQENKKINDPPSLKEEDKKEKINVRLFKESNDKENISLIKIKDDFNFPNDMNFDKSHMPSLELKKSNVETRNRNIPIYLAFNTIFSKKDYDNILKTLKIKEGCLITQKIYGDGNCLFRSISYFLTGTEAYHVFMRNLLYNYIINHYEDIITNYPYVYYNGSPINTDEYIPLIQENGNYGGELECNIFTKVIPINILVLTYNENVSGINTYNYYMYYGYQNVDNYIPLCILDYNESKKHYQLLYYDNLFNEDTIFTENEDNNCSYISSKDLNEKNLEDIKVNASLQNDRLLENENKNKIYNSNSSPDIKLFITLTVSHEKDILLNPDKNENNYEEDLNFFNKENKKNSESKFEIKNRISPFEYNQIEKCLKINKIEIKDFKLL